MRPYAFVTGDDAELQPLDLHHDDNYDDWKAKEAEATSSVRNRPVRPGLVRTGTDGNNPSVREPDGDGAVFLRLDGDGRKGRPSTEKS